MRNKRLGILAGLLVSVAGCSAQIPQDIYVSSINPFFVVIDSGRLHSERIYDSQGNEIGLRVEKEHFILGKVGEQTLYLPREARNVGWNIKRRIFGLDIYGSFNIGEQRFETKYKVTENVTQSKIERVRQLKN